MDGLSAQPSASAETQDFVRDFVPFDALPRAHGPALVQCLLRAAPEDFLVEETLSFSPDDEGSHWLLQVRKTGANTEWVARQLARIADVPVRDIGYAGLKDRHAVAIQWFSLPLGEGPAPDWSPLVDDGVEVLGCHRHGRKLRRGAIASNSFALRLRELSGDVAALATQLEAIARYGVPNYFGPQRFGRDGGNLAEAGALLVGTGTGTGSRTATGARAGIEAGASGGKGRGRRLSRHRRGLLLSAARSALFNQVLARRVALGNWNQALPGERLQLAGSHSHFLAETLDETIIERLASGDISPTGPLCGAGESLTTGVAAELEAQALAPWTDWIDGLARAGLRAERRALILRPLDLTHQLEAEDCLMLRFRLPAGAYATSVLRELADWSEPAPIGREQ
ncbi:tRNA pseudouridine synthase D [Thiorhodovibrio litoralis]|nr:tRNA pseudouridine(13) synthase TruD [Thiorhodovibrio winogradskyi]WPL12539.1 tRNA pseudouridine synthase D [Thiorhodovibrio litoralis]